MGFEAGLGAIIYANGSSAQNATTVGYYASALGQIEAYGTSAGSVNTATKYNPSTSDTLGNANGMIRFS